MREIIRVVEGLDGTVLFDLAFEPRPNYARTPGRTVARGRDWVCTWGNEIIRLRSERELQPRGGGVGAELEIKAGEKLYFSLSYETGDIAILLPLGEDAFDRLPRTDRTSVVSGKSVSVRLDRGVRRFIKKKKLR